MESPLQGAAPYCGQYHHCQVYLSHDVEKNGWLNKQGGNFGQWRRRWFVQSNNYLFYFKNPQDSEPRGSIPLEEVEVVKQPQDGEQGIFLVHHKDLFSYYLQSEEGPEDVDDWIESIRWAKYSALKSGYFLLDDKNLKLKEQLRQEVERTRVLQLECDKLRSGAADSESKSMVTEPQQNLELKRLKGELRQLQRERSGKVGLVLDPDVFEPTRTDFRVLVYRQRYDENNILGELILKPDCTFDQVHQIISEDLGQTAPFSLIHGHLGDPLGRAGNLLGDEFARSTVQQVFRDHDGEMLIVRPNPDSDSTRAVMGTNLGRSLRSVEEPGSGTAINVPVYWRSKDPQNQKGNVAIYEGDTVRDVRARLAMEFQFIAGKEFTMKRRKVPMMPRKDDEPARKYFSDVADYIVIESN